MPIILKYCIIILVNVILKCSKTTVLKFRQAKRPYFASFQFLGFQCVKANLGLLVYFRRLFVFGSNSELLSKFVAILFQEYVSKGITYLVFYGDLQTKEGKRRSEFHLAGLKNSETPSSSSVWPSDHREDYRSCAWPYFSPVRSFLKRCTLTNKAVGTIWRVLSKPPHMRQGPDPRPSNC